jgi:hypothetical protein
MMKLRIWLLAFMVNFTIVATAQGAVIKWVLDAALVIESGTAGGVATGSFLFDTDTMLFSDIALITSADSRSGGLLFDEFRFATTFIPGNLPILGEITFGQSSTPTGKQIAFDISVGLSDLMVAGIFQWDGGRFAEYTCIPPETGPFTYCSEGRFVSNWSFDDPNTLTGTLLVPEVPLPAAFPLFLFGLLGLNFVNLSRRCRVKMRGKLISKFGAIKLLIPRPAEARLIAQTAHSVALRV